MYFLVEVQYKHFVLRVAGRYKRKRGGDYLRTFRPHAPALIDDQSDCDWNIGVCKLRDGLRFSVFHDPEIIFRQTCHESARRILYAHVQQHQPRRGANRKLFFLGIRWFSEDKTSYNERRNQNFLVHDGTYHLATPVVTTTAQAENPAPNEN